MRHEHGGFRHQLAGLENIENTFVAILAVAQDFYLTSVYQQAIAGLVAFIEQNLPRTGVLSQSVTAQMLDDLDGQTLQETVASQQFKQSWTRAGHVDFCHWGAGMKMGEFLFDNSSHYTNLHAIYLSRVSSLGCISGKKWPFRQRAAGYSLPCAWTSL